MRQLDGRKSLWSDVMMSMKRSDHIPSWTKFATTNRPTGLVRIRLIQRAWTEMQLQKMTPQKTQAYGPNGRSYIWTYISYVLPLYQARNGSTMYVYVTTHPVTRSIFAMLSRWFFVMTFCILKIARAGIISCSTIANPE